MFNSKTEYTMLVDEIKKAAASRMDKIITAPEIIDEAWDIPVNAWDELQTNIERIKTEITIQQNITKQLSKKLDNSSYFDLQDWQEYCKVKDEEVLGKRDDINNDVEEIVAFLKEMWNDGLDRAYLSTADIIKLNNYTKQVKQSIPDLSLAPFYGDIENIPEDVCIGYYNRSLEIYVDKG